MVTDRIEHIGYTFRPFGEERWGCLSTFNDMEEHVRHSKSLEVHHRQHYCESRCVSRVPVGELGWRYGDRGQTRETPGRTFAIKSVDHFRYCLSLTCSIHSTTFPLRLS